MYQYLIYDTIIESELKLYNLCETTGIPEAHIRFGSIAFDTIPEDQKSFYISHNHVIIESDYCFYSIKDGNNILIQKKENLSLSDDLLEARIAAYIFGWCFAFLFYQRGYSSIHCTAINMNNHGIIISGASGSGKSSTALGLQKKGYKYITDDVAIINPIESINLIPSYPLQKMCRNEISTIPQDKLLYIDEDRDKYSYLNTENFCSTPVPLTDIFLLNVGDVDNVTITEHNGVDKFMQTLSCLFFAEIYAIKGISDDDKFRMLKLSSQVNVYTITRPKTGNSIDQIIQLIEHYSNS